MLPTRAERAAKIARSPRFKFRQEVFGGERRADGIDREEKAECVREVRPSDNRAAAPTSHDTLQEEGRSGLLSVA